MKKLTDMFRTTSEVDETQGPVEEDTQEEVTSKIQIILWNRRNSKSQRNCGAEPVLTSCLNLQKNKSRSKLIFKLMSL